MSADLTQLFDLSVPEKLDIIEALWTSIVSKPESLPVPDWQKEELARRKAAYLRNPDSAISWEEAIERIRGGHSQ